MDVNKKTCAHEDCSKWPSFGPDGSKGGVYSRQHAMGGMVSVAIKHCAHGSCSKWPSFGPDGSKGGVYCRQHALDGMVDVK